MAGLDAPRHGLTCTIAGISAYTPAWRLRSLFGLRQAAPKDRENQKIAEADGELGYPGLKAGRMVDLEFYVDGAADHTGAANADAWLGVENSVQYLRENMYEAVVDARGCVDVAVGVPPRSWTGGIQLDDFEVKPGPDPESSRLVFMTARLPLGELALVVP